jgi:hypothetical protein
VEEEKKHVLTRADIVTDLKEGLLGKQPGCGLSVFCVLFVFLLISVLLISRNGYFFPFALPFLALALICGWGAVYFILQFRYYRSIVRRDSYVIDAEPSPLLYTETYEIRSKYRPLEGYRFVFSSGKWEAPDHPYPCLKGACLPAMSRERNSEQHGDLFYLVKDKKGRVLYAYNTRFFALSKELLPTACVPPIR